MGRLFALMLLCIESVSAQNFIKNPSFEDHRSLDCLTCHILPERFAGIMQGWRNLTGSNLHICDCNYKRNSTEINYNYCPSDQVKPYDGCTMIEMEYMPSCYDFNHNTRGCASYLSSKLSEPLEIGKTYEVSFWINIQKPEDPEYTKHIGFMLYPEYPVNRNGEMLGGSAFLIDDSSYNSWNKVKWVVQPVCKLQYLAIGVFRSPDGPPVHGKPHRNVYYIDQVSVEKIPDTRKEQEVAIPFCNYDHQVRPHVREVDGVTCYFNFKDSSFLQEYQGALDSFALRMLENPQLAFMISGHTDSIGSNNLELSSKRIAQVLLYLEKKHGIPKERFVRVSAGSSEPIASNTTERGRKLNRRVEIKQVDCGLPMVIYRNLLLHVFDAQYNEAYKLLRFWLSIADDEHKLLILFDPRIEVLRKNKEWSQIENQVKKSYSKYKNEQLAYQLDSLWAEDQKYRTLGYYLENLAAYVQGIDKTDTRWDIRFPDQQDSILVKLDEEHYHAFVKFNEKKDWPRISEIGKRPAKSAFLIVNHTMDTIILTRYMAKIKRKCEEGEAEWLFYATMYDRLQTIKGLPQRFGTQYKVIDESKNQYELFPLEDAAKVNQWRKEIGMEAIEGF